LPGGLLLRVLRPG